MRWIEDMTGLKCPPRLPIPTSLISLKSLPPGSAARLKGVTLYFLRDLLMGSGEVV
jgi:hypothetical protein